MPINLNSTDHFANRHIGSNSKELEKMLQVIGVGSIDQLIDETVPTHIRLSEPVKISEAASEFQILKHLKAVAKKNQVFKSFIGSGYSDCVVPSVILRNIFENPGWYTQYTPYQS